MADDTTRDGWLGSAAIPGEWLETPRPGMFYTMLQRRERGQLVLRLMESTNAEGPDIDHLERALAVIVVQKGALPRVLDALASYTAVLASQTEMRTRLSNLEQPLPEDLGKREPFDGA
jgi:hypothetical protein